MREIRLHRVTCRPGYGDMLGGYHSVSLEKVADGKWTFVRRDREEHSKPTIVCTYEVSQEDVRQFAEYIGKNRVLSLEKRRKSNLFVTDYSPWSWNIDYETTSFGKIKKKYCCIDEYRKYSGRDYDLLNELRRRFESLRGEKISETAEE